MNHPTFNPKRSRPARRSERGFMIIAMMVMLAMMLIYVAASTRSLRQLRQELKLVEQKQVQRLQASTVTATRTNAAAPAP